MNRLAVFHIQGRYFAPILCVSDCFFFIWVWLQLQRFLFRVVFWLRVYTVVVSCLFATYKGSHGLQVKNQALNNCSTCSGLSSANKLAITDNYCLKCVCFFNVFVNALHFSWTIWKLPSKSHKCHRCFKLFWSRSWFHPRPDTDVPNEMWRLSRCIWRGCSHMLRSTFALPTGNVSCWEPSSWRPRSGMTRRSGTSTTAKFLRTSLWKTCELLNTPDIQVYGSKWSQNYKEIQWTHYKNIYTAVHLYFFCVFYSYTDK